MNINHEWPKNKVYFWQVACIVSKINQGDAKSTTLPPWGSRFHNVAKSVEQFSQAVFSLGSILSHQKQMRYDQLPFLTTYITEVWLPVHNGGKLNMLSPQSV
jgi:hypothetical protein